MKPHFPFDAALHAIHASAHRFRNGICGMPELSTVILRYVPSIEGHAGFSVSCDALRADLVTSCNDWLASRDDADLKKICGTAEQLRARLAGMMLL